MTERVALVASNVAFVQQGIALVEAIDDAAFVRTAAPMYTSGVGPHLRHCVDHYVSFLLGYRDGAIDYDARGRDAAVETDRAAARRALDRVLDGLCEMTADDLSRAVRIACECSPWEDDALVAAATHERANDSCASNVGRELMFLVSHTVHHYALIAQILRHQAIEVPRGFGVAPSTLSHRRRLAESRLAAAPF